MVRAGAPRQSDSTLKMRGTYAKQKSAREDKGQPISWPDQFPAAPGTLHELAKEEWDRIESVIGKVEMVKSTDRTVMAAYCRSWAYCVLLDRLVKTKRLGTMDDKGRPIKNPWWQMANEAWRDAVKFAGLLGFTPSDRSRVRQPTKKTEGKEKKWAGKAAS